MQAVKRKSRHELKGAIRELKGACRALREELEQSNMNREDSIALQTPRIPHYQCEQFTFSILFA